VPLSVYNLKPRFQKLLRPVTAALAEAGISANQVTLAALVLSVVCGGVIALWPERSWLLLLLPLVLFVRMALNAVDGMLAREHGQASALGAILNELGDLLSDAALYLPLALVPGLSAPLVVLAVVLALIAEAAGILALAVGAPRRYDGPMGKSDRAVVFGGLGFVLALGVPPGAWLDWVLWLVVLLLVLTAVNRVRRALEERAP
jgi:CDP-diacylglycerol--glycerol-3-phosphate 3-phosphatidyltransferase